MRIRAGMEERVYADFFHVHEAYIIDVLTFTDREEIHTFVVRERKRDAHLSLLTFLFKKYGEFHITRERAFSYRGIPSGLDVEEGITEVFP